MLWIDYFRERDTTGDDIAIEKNGCRLIILGNEIQLSTSEALTLLSCGLITLGNEIQLGYGDGAIIYRCGLITLGRGWCLLFQE